MHGVWKWCHLLSSHKPYKTANVIKLDSCLVKLIFNSKLSSFNGRFSTLWATDERVKTRNILSALPDPIADKFSGRRGRKTEFKFALYWLFDHILGFAIPHKRDVKCIQSKVYGFAKRIDEVHHWRNSLRLDWNGKKWDKGNHKEKLKKNFKSFFLN